MLDKLVAELIEKAKPILEKKKKIYKTFAQWKNHV